MTGVCGGKSTRRVSGTAAMGVRMAFQGAVEPGGEGHEVLVRVRLLHAALRRFLVDEGRFKHPTEQPINQQDLAITLALFGYLNIRGLGMMGIPFTPAALASYNLLWRYAGHDLGIDADLLPRPTEHPHDFFFACLPHQARPEKPPTRAQWCRTTLSRYARAEM